MLCCFCAWSVSGLLTCWRGCMGGWARYLLCVRAGGCGSGGGEVVGADRRVGGEACGEATQAGEGWRGGRGEGREKRVAVETEETGERVRR